MTIGDWLKSQIQSLLFPTSSIGAIDWGGGRSEEAKQGWNSIHGMTEKLL
jgi:hypothetical protein